MDRVRILLVPTVTEVEWRIKPLIEEWAEVASFDAPGVGSEPATELTQAAIVARGVAEIARRGWKECVIVGDEAGAVQAVGIAAAAPAAARALVLGHPALSFDRDGPRPGLNGEVFDALMRLARTDYRSFVRALCQLTRHAYDDEMADAYLERVTQNVAVEYLGHMLTDMEAEQLEETLRALGKPMLLVEHRDCVGWTRESYEDAVAAFPEASTAVVEIKPSCDPRFAEILKDFCEELSARQPPRASARGRP